MLKKNCQIYGKEILGDKSYLNKVLNSIDWSKKKSPKKKSPFFIAVFYKNSNKKTKKKITKKSTRPKTLNLKPQKP